MAKVKKDWFQVLFRRRIMVALMILLQIGFMYFLIWGGSNLSKVINGLLNIISLLVVLHIIKNKSKNAYKIVWIVLILLFPVFGGMFYLMIKVQSSTRKFSKVFDGIQNKTEKSFYLPGDACKKAVSESQKYSNQIKYLQNHAHFPVYANTDTKFYSVGEAFFEALLEELKKAEKYIFLEYFIVQEGKMWNTILNILEEKAAAGVDVRIIYDDMGCFLLLPDDYADYLRRKGIKCRIFNPFRPFVEALQNNRDHRKIAVIDGITAFTGGINLADEYINEIVKYGHWKDSAVMMKGDAAWSFTMMFFQMWNLCTGHFDDYESFYTEPECIEECKGFVQPYCDSPVDSEHVAEQVYLHIINSAKDYLYINTPYLIIDESISTALIMAAKSGVDVRIVTPGIWDKRFVHFTTKSYYRDLIEGGVRIYEYEKGFMHSKVFVSDDSVATVGTVNLDYRSLYLHFECGVCLYDTESVLSVKEDFLETLKVCKEINAKDCKGNAVTRFLGEVFRVFAPLL